MDGNDNDNDEDARDTWESLFRLLWTEIWPEDTKHDDEWWQHHLLNINGSEFVSTPIHRKYFSFFAQCYSILSWTMSILFIGYSVSISCYQSDNIFTFTWFPFHCSIHTLSIQFIHLILLTQNHGETYYHEKVKILHIYLFPW